jgi:hypothetical protein
MWFTSTSQASGAPGATRSTRRNSARRFDRGTEGRETRFHVDDHRVGSLPRRAIVGLALKDVRMHALTLAVSLVMLLLILTHSAALR